MMPIGGMCHVPTSPLARWFERRIHDSVPVTCSAARLYGLTVVDPAGLGDHLPGAARTSYVAEDADPHRLLARCPADLATCHDAVALLVTGWAASPSHELELELELTEPGESAARVAWRRVRVVAVVSDSGVAAVARRLGRADGVVPIPVRCLGALASALVDRWVVGGELRSAS